MAKGDFVWCDLSTFRVANTKSFYSRLFGWTYDRLTQPDGSPYEVASTSAGEAAAIFEMPEKFQKIGLPSFWMPYIEVDSVETTCEEARRAGAKVEVGPVAWSGEDRIALIRDPLGAGFTVYQGTGLKPHSNREEAGHRVWCALYVSDVSAVKDFYETIFDWNISRDPTDPGAYRVRNAQGVAVADIHELREEIRGQYEFWGVHFAVSDLARATDEIGKNDSKIVYRDQGFGQSTILVKDPDGAAFFIRETSRQTGESLSGESSGRAAMKWKTILGLLLIGVAVLFEQNWLWGVLFILWTVLAVRSGETFFVEPLSRRANPLLFWLLIATWIGLSLYLVVTDLA